MKKRYFDIYVDGHWRMSVTEHHKVLISDLHGKTIEIKTSMKNIDVEDLGINENDPQELRDIADRFLHRKATIGELQLAVKAAMEDVLKGEQDAAH